jgi:SOS response regulatory protein OraA/RecX
MAPVFRLLYSPQGILQSFFNWAHIPIVVDWLSRPNTALYVLMSVAIWEFTGMSFILYYAAMSQIDMEMLEAARIDGAGNLRTLWSMVLPNCRGTTVSMAMLGVIGALKTFDIPEEEKTKILDYLLDNRFVNDERFAKSFVRGKINQSGWGVNKIRFHLIQKGIDKDIIDEALGQTDNEVYRQRLIDILKTKSKTIKADSDFEKKRKLAAYAMQKGFEGSLVWETLKDLAI